MTSKSGKPEGKQKDAAASPSKKRGRTGAAGRWLGSPVRLAASVLVLAFVLYANTIGNDFVWDDRDLIVDNPAVRVLDPETVVKIFTEDFWKSSQLGGGYYRPLVTLSYHIHYAMFDGKPGGFHFVNAAWNAVACMLVFVFVYLLFRNTVYALVAGLLFAVHPVHTESVAWVSGRTDVLSTMWAIASLVFYLLARRRRRLPWLAAALAAFALSLLAKESSAFLPLVILILEFGPFATQLPGQLPPSRHRLLAPVLYFVVLALYLLQRRAVIGTLASTYDGYAEGALGLVALPLSILAGYAWKLVFPMRLSGEYDAPVPGSFADVHVVAGFLILAAIVWAAIRYHRRPEVVLGAGIFLFGLGPVINLIPIGEISAERFLYFPSLGFVLVAAGFFSSALTAKYPSLRNAGGDGYTAYPRMKPSLAGNLVILFAVVLVAYGARTVARNADWSTEEILFAKTAEASPESARARLNVGNVARRQGRLDDAIAAYKRALEIDPNYPDALSNLAGIYASQRRIDEALPLVERALRSAPDDITLRNNLGSIYFAKKRYADASRQFEHVLELDAQQPIAHYNLGLIQFEESRLDEAKAHFEQVAGRGAQFNRAFYYLAVIEESKGNAAAAKQHAQRFLSVYSRNDQFRQRAQRIVSSR